MAAQELYLTPLYSDANLVAYYRMEGNANDTTGNYNGTSNSVTYGTLYGKFNDGSSYDGSASYISVPNSSNLTPSTMTWTFWINPTTLPGTGVIYGLIDKRDDTGGTAGYVIELYNDGAHQYISIVSTSSGYGGQVNIGLTTGAWSLVTIILANGSVPVVYVNGVSQTVGSSTSGSTSNYAAPLNIGRRSDGHYFDGYLDDVALFSRALTSTEAYNLYNGFPSTAWMQTCSESLTLTDSLSRSTVRSLSESLTLSDVLTAGKIKIQTLLESISLTDTLPKSLARTLTESITLTDTLVKSPVKNLTESISLTDTLTRAITKVLTETVTLTDVVRKFINGLLAIYSNKYTKQNTSYSDKYTAQGTTYTNKYNHLQ